MNKEELLRAHISSFSMAISREQKKGFGLLSIDLHVGISPREPHATWPSGEPVSADYEIGIAEAKDLVTALAELNLLSSTNAFYSERTVNANISPPEWARKFEVLQSGEENIMTPYMVQAKCFDDNWHYYFQNWCSVDEVKKILSMIDRKDVCRDFLDER